jgi:hypothetical protein
MGCSACSFYIGRDRFHLLAAVAAENRAGNHFGATVSTAGRSRRLGREAPATMGTKLAFFGQLAATIRTAIGLCLRGLAQRFFLSIQVGQPGFNQQYLLAGFFQSCFCQLSLAMAFENLSADLQRARVDFLFERRYLFVQLPHLSLAIDLTADIAHEISGTLAHRAK